MRRLILVAGALAVVAGVGAVGQDLTDVQDSTARDMLRRSRQALGAVDTLARLRSLLPTGHSARPQQGARGRADRAASPLSFGRASVSLRR